MANSNVKTKIILLIFLLLSSPLFSTKLFYLSTERTYSEEELKKVKVESGSLNEVKIRVYKINNTESYFLTQEDFHRPKVKGRKFRYITPEVIKGFKSYLKSELREWSRENIPSDERGTILESYNDLSTKSEEKYFKPSKQVDYITDKNFTLIKEKKYVFERRSNNWNTNSIYFNSLPHGTYLIEGIAGEKLAYTVLNVSKFSFITKKSADTLLVYSVDSTTGEPASDVEVNVYNRFNKKLDSKKTNIEGIANFNIENDDLFIVANDGKGSFSFYDPKYYPASVSSDRYYIYTDRPIYKGGDSVNIKGIIRNKVGDNYKIPKVKNLQIAIKNEQGTIIGSVAATSLENGSFSGSLKLPEDSKGGLYKVITTRGDERYEAEFKVEYYVKPEFKLTLTPKKKTYLPNENIIFKVKGEYFHGEPVTNLEVNYSISRSKFIFKEVSRDKLKSFLSFGEWNYTGIERLSNNTITLDDSGNGEITFKVKPEDIKDNTPYTYIVNATGANISGADVAATGRTKVVPSNINYTVNTHKYVYNPGEDITLNINITDYDSNPITSEVKIKAILDDKEISSKNIKSDENGNIEYTLASPDSGILKIEVSGKDKSGNNRTVSKSVWIGEDGASYSVAGGYVKLILDKSYYSSKDNAKLLVVSPIEGISMLLTVEGNSIYDKRVIKLNSNSSLINIPLKKQYLPNSFINVDFIYENRHYSNSIKLDLPPVENFLNIDIEANKDYYSPNSKGKVKITVKDYENKPVKNTDISIAVIDEAIYSIQEDLTIDIRKFFYPFRRNNVMTWTSTGFRFYGYAYNVRRELAYDYYKNATGIASFKGGDEEEKRENFKDSILWIPNITTDEKGEATFEIDFPGNITSWRVTAIAINKDTKVGLTKENIITKKEIFTTISSPKIVGSRDKTYSYIKISNESMYKKDLKAEIIGNGLEPNDESASIKSFSLKPGESYTETISYKPENIESATIIVNVYEADEILDSTVKKVDIKNFGLDKHFTETRIIPIGTSTIEFNTPSDMNQGGDKLTITLLDSFTGHINDSLDYLVQYPHGCVEQTTNKFLPNIAVVESFRNMNIPISTSSNLEKNVKVGVATLSSHQNENGSWGWWDGSQENIHMTSYVLYGLLRANRAGFYVDDKVLDKGLNFIRENIQNSETAIFPLYVLSLADIKVFSVYESIDPVSLNDYELSLYIRTVENYNGSVKESVDILMERRQSIGNSMIKWGTDSTRSWKEDSIETTAHILETLDRYIDKEEYIKGINYLLSKKKGNKWKSTRDTGAAIIALSKLITRSSLEVSSVNILFNGKAINKDNYLTLDNYRIQVELDINDIKDKNIIEFKNSDSSLTSIVDLKYRTTSENILSANNGFQVERKYYKLKDDLSLGEESNSFIKGDNILVELTLDQSQNDDYIMINDYIPAGTRFNKDIPISNLNISAIDYPSYIDPRYEVVNIFYEYSGSKRLYYVLTAQYPGEFKVNPTFTELMYFPELNGNSKSDLIKIGER